MSRDSLIQVSVRTLRFAQSSRDGYGGGVVAALAREILGFTAARSPVFESADYRGAL